MFRTALISMFLTSTALATTWTVDDDGKADFNTIQAAVNAASDGDEIIVMPGTYTTNVPGYVVNMLGKEIWLHSSNGPEETIINGENKRIGLLCATLETSKTIIDGLTFIDCVECGMLNDYGTSPTINNCIFYSNGPFNIQFAQNDGGGMYNFNSNPTITNCTFNNNVADTGGGIYNLDSNPVIENCTFIDNIAIIGGGINNDNSDTNLTDCTFTNNTTDDWWAIDIGSGGGMSNFDSSPTLTNCTFWGNTAGGADDIGGGGMFNDFSNPTLIGCLFENNSTSYYGGGMFNLNSSDPVLNDCVFDSNTTDYVGGGMYNVQSRPILINCTLSNNTTANGGGGIANNDSDLMLINCDLTNNSEWNTQYGLGGAIFDYLSVTTITGCLLSDNNAAGSGDGYFATNSSTLENVGTNTTDELEFEEFSEFAFAAESVCTVEGQAITTFTTSTSFDIDDLETNASLIVNGSLFVTGNLTITNESSSLMGSTVGETIPLAQAKTIIGDYFSFVFPPMPEGLGLQLNWGNSLQGIQEIAIEVIETENAQFADPFIGNLENPPIDIIEFDANGDGRDELALLLAINPNVVVVYQVSEDGIPTLINGFLAIVGNDPVGMDAVDLNSDGNEDLLVANATDNSITVLLTVVDEEETLSFDVSTVSVPGANQTITCVSGIDWDGDTDLDAVVGVNLDSQLLEDGYRVLLDISGTTSNGPWLSIPQYNTNPFLEFPVLVSDPPTCVDGGTQQSSWGFVGGTRYGRIHRVNSATGSLQEIGNLSGNNTVSIKAIELDSNGGDGQLDLMVSSDEAQAIYLFQGDHSTPEDFGDIIPLTVSLPAKDIIALDADFDGDMDIVMTVDSPDTSLILLRNDGDVEELHPQSLGGQIWSMQILSTSTQLTKIASGDLNGKDEDDDWLIGTGGTVVLRGETTGVMERSNIQDNIECGADLNNDGLVGATDLLMVLAAWGPCEGCDEDFDEDGAVGIVDLLYIIATWGPCE